MSPSRCPHPDPVELAGHSFAASEVIDRLRPYITPERRARIDEVVAGRTYSVVPVLEGLYDRGNVSAVLRSAEALGFQAVHLIETSKKFKKAKRVTQGAEKWLDVEAWESTEACVARLRDQGYRILAAHAGDSRPIAEFTFDAPTAVCFGNEHEGLSEALLAEADDHVEIPMPGFTRSFNISVAAALTLYHIYNDRVASGGHGDLTDDERTRLTASYYARSVEHADAIMLRQLEASSAGD